jgi:phospholipase A-2-activating protein
LQVRAVVFPGPNIVISASRDGTVRVWKIINSPPPTFDATISSHGSAFVNTAAYLSPTKNYPQGLIISGGKDTVIEVREPSKSPEDNAEALLLGHTSNVCALDVDADGEFIVSGSWDGKARLWSVEKWDCVAIMEEHEASVWAVLAYNSKTVITGSADKFIRIYNTSGRLLRSIPGGGDVIRALCKVPKNHPSGADFASASNDGIIRLWTIDGRQVGELIGHESFIYSLAYLATGELVSSGEDRTVRVWKGTNCIQTITLPALSVWGVAVCSQNGDIAAGASDRLIRVFSRDPDRYADAESIRLFEESVKASSIPQQSVGEINKEKLPGPEFLTQKSGTKEGQVQMINEPNGSITAHQWSASQQEWINIGTVVDAVGSSGKKVSRMFLPDASSNVFQVEFGGKSYDFVFDVDIEDGKPALKLPYNLSDNPYEAATKFIEKNKLPISYLDQVANFITTNTQGSTLGSSSNPGPAPVGSDPWGSEARYRPGGDTSSAPPRSAAPKILPQQTYLSIVHASYDGMSSSDSVLT